MSFFCGHTSRDIFCYRLDSESRPCLKKINLVALINLDLTGLNSAASSYLTKYVFFVMRYALSILCSISLPIFALLFS